MMGLTHTVFAVAGASLLLGTSDPAVIGVAAIASQLPDIDTSKSTIGRVCLPVSRLLEYHFPHRSITHSFVATACIAIAALPLLFLPGLYWQALVLGYFLGWFADAFTKSGVCAFYPSAARLVIPGNPRLRLSTGSGAEIFVLALLVTLAIASLQINSTGGILKSFNAVLGIPGGAVEMVGDEGSRYLMYVQVKGRNAMTQAPIDDLFEVIKPLTQTDLLIKDSQGHLYRAGISQESQILVTQMRAHRGPAAQSQIRQLDLQSQDVAHALAGLPTERTYLNGSLVVEDAEDLSLMRDPQYFSTITHQPLQGAAIVTLESASPSQVYQLLGHHFASGTLIVRSIHVRS